MGNSGSGANEEGFGSYRAIDKAISLGSSSGGGVRSNADKIRQWGEFDLLPEFDSEVDLTVYCQYDDLPVKIKGLPAVPGHSRLYIHAEGYACLKLELEREIILNESGERESKSFVSVNLVTDPVFDCEKIRKIPQPGTARWANKELKCRDLIEVNRTNYCKIKKTYSKNAFEKNEPLQIRNLDVNEDQIVPLEHLVYVRKVETEFPPEGRKGWKRFGKVNCSLERVSKQAHLLMEHHGDFHLISNNCQTFTKEMQKRLFGTSALTPGQKSVIVAGGSIGALGGIGASLGLFILLFNPLVATTTIPVAAAVGMGVGGGSCAGISGGLLGDICVRKKAGNKYHEAENVVAKDKGTNG